MRRGDGAALLIQDQTEVGPQAAEQLKIRGQKDRCQFNLSAVGTLYSAGKRRRTAEGERGSYCAGHMRAIVVIGAFLWNADIFLPVSQSAPLFPEVTGPSSDD